MGLASFPEQTQRPALSAHGCMEARRIPEVRVSTEKGQALPEDSMRSQKTFMEVQNRSRIRTRDTRKDMISLGKQ